MVYADRGNVKKGNSGGYMRKYIVSVVGMLFAFVFLNSLAVAKTAVKVMTTYDNGEVDISSPAESGAEIKAISKQEMTEIAKQAAAEVVQAMSKKNTEVAVQPVTKQVSSEEAMLAFKQKLSEVFPSAAKEEKVKIFDHIVVGVSLRSFERISSPEFSWNAAHTQNYDKKDIMFQSSIEAKYQWLGIEVVPSIVKRQIAVDWWGTDLGIINVKTSNIFFANVYPIDKEKYSLGVGVGAEFTKISWQPFLVGPSVPLLVLDETKKWTPVAQVKGTYHINSRLSLVMAVVASNLKIQVGQVMTRYNGRITFGATCGLF